MAMYASATADPLPWDETDYDAVDSAAARGDIKDLARLLQDGDVYRQEVIDLQPAEHAELRTRLRARSIGIFEPGDGTYIFLTVRTCCTCGEDVIADDQCPTCLGMPPVVIR